MARLLSLRFFHSFHGLRGANKGGAASEVRRTSGLLVLTIMMEWRAIISFSWVGGWEREGSWQPTASPQHAVVGFIGRVRMAFKTVIKKKEYGGLTMNSA